MVVISTCTAQKVNLRNHFNIGPLPQKTKLNSKKGLSKSQEKKPENEVARLIGILGRKVGLVMWSK